MADTRYRWDARNGRYRDATTGQYVPEPVVRQALDQVIGAAGQRATDLSKGLVEGRVSLADWQEQMRATLKPLHAGAYMAAHGGRAQMTQSDYGRLGAGLKKQYGFLNRFAAQVASGEQKLDGSLVARAQLYTEAARGTFEDQRRAEMGTRGYQAERRVLHPADHCEDCVEFAARGWAPLRSLPRIGDSICHTRCHCTMEFRRAPAAAQGAGEQPAPEPEAETTQPETAAPVVDGPAIRRDMEAMAVENERRLDVARDRVNAAWDQNFDLAVELEKLIAQDLPVTDPRIRSINRRIDRSAARITQAKAERDRISRSLTKDIREKHIYYQGPPAQPNTIVQATTTADRDIWSEGLEEFRKIVGKGAGADGKTVTIKPAVQPAGVNDGRSFYRDSEKAVHMDPGSNTVRTVVHELGHWLESNGGWQDEVQGHLARRTTGEAATQLPLDRGFRLGEVSRPDRFYHAYMGKDYGGRASELLSMALEHLYTDPLEFARKDPETFDWAMNVLRSRNRP